MNAPGFNPMRWRCEDRGCYNVIHRPKIEVFAAALPRNIGMSDIDAFTEVGGRFLFVEWKGAGVQDVPTGQRLAFERLTSISPRITVAVVSGDPEAMTVQAVKIIRKGIVSAWEPSSIADLTGRIRDWGQRADRRPARAA